MLSRGVHAARGRASLLASRKISSTNQVLNEAKTVKVTINGKVAEVPAGLTVIQACQSQGVEIPRFCFHERLSVAGNCRMCLVEVEKARKPMASCAINVADGMKVFTDTPMVHKAREGVMEFLLANHPLDCPICDQGGECDLQDQSMAYGSDRSRYHEDKRCVEDKDIGPLVKTSMNRCIHCTRCVRFSEEVAGVADLGTTGRGNQMEIGTYVAKMFGSELSGNVIDLCPVGALTSKPFAFTARSWELRPTESIDVTDAMGSWIRVDARGTEVMRVVPRVNEDINEEWISDKTRFSYDGLKRQRLNVPLVNGEAVPWEDALAAVKVALSKAKGNEIKAVAGDLVDVESMVALKDLLNRLGSNNMDFEDTKPGTHYSADHRTGYLFNTTIAGIEKADAILLVGTHPRKEAAVLNSRIRKAYRQGHLEHVAMIGAPADLTYPVEHLGLGTKALSAVSSGAHPYTKIFANAKRPMVVVGSDLNRRSDGAAISQMISELVKHVPALSQSDWNGINTLHTAAARVGALDVGFMPGPDVDENAKPKFLYLLGADKYDMSQIPDDCFVVYQGHHGDEGAMRADIILPGAAYTEKSATYVNTEGRAQRTVKAVAPPGQARQDWHIIRALSEVVGQKLPYDTTSEIRARMEAIAPHLVKVDAVEHDAHICRETYTKALQQQPKVKATESVFDVAIQNFYMTDVISRTSSIMAACTAALRK